MHPDLLERRLRSLQRQIRILGAAVVLLSALLVAAAARPPAEVLRARGLVITDAAGRERIVLGAPLREASADPKLAAAVGLAVLDSAGRLNVALGADNPLVLPDGRMGERIAGSAGFTIYDPRNGGERGGMGAFVDGRANICLDYARPKEAACMAVAPGDQYAAVLLNGTPSEKQFDRVVMYVGADGGGSIKAFGGGENDNGVMIRAGRGALPAIMVFDSAGKPALNVVERVGSGN